MGVSGCTSCQLGGPEALQAYDRAYQAKRNEEAAAADAGVQDKVREARRLDENRPVPGATVGGYINIRV
jgi:hypothetical protein